jgi:hypothetical protein
VIAAHPTDVLVDRIVKDVNDNLSNKEVSDGIGWYSKMREWFQKKFGANIELFGQLLAATSARTPVDINFRQSVDAMRQFSLGKYDDMLNRYHDYVKGVESMSDDAALKASGFKKKSHTDADVIDATFDFELSSYVALNNIKATSKCSKKGFVKFPQFLGRTATINKNKREKIGGENDKLIEIIKSAESQPKEKAVKAKRATKAKK